MAERLISGGRRRDVRGNLAGKSFSLIAAPTESSEIRPEGAKAPSSAAFGIGRPTCFMASSVAGTARALNLPTKSCRPSSAKLRAVLIRMIPPGQAREHVDLVQQRRVLDDDRVGLEDRLAHADFLVIDAAERDYGRAGALRAEARERLGVLPRGRRRSRASPRRSLRPARHGRGSVPGTASVSGVGRSAFDLGQCQAPHGPWSSSVPIARRTTRSAAPSERGKAH